MPLTGALLDGPEDDPKAIKKWLGDEGLAVLREVGEVARRFAEFRDKRYRRSVGRRGHEARHQQG